MGSNLGMEIWIYEIGQNLDVVHIEKQREFGQNLEVDQELGGGKFRPKFRVPVPNLSHLDHLPNCKSELRLSAHFYYNIRRVNPIINDFTA